MPTGTSTGDLDNAQRVILAAVRYTMEHSMPLANMITSMTLPRGAKSVIVPRVGQFTFHDLIETVDLEDEEEIGMTTAELTTGEVGAKIILTDKLARQQNDDVFTMVGRQFGDGAGRKMDTDIISLFPGLNGGTVLGADNKNLTMTNAAAVIAYARAHKFGGPLALVHHPNAIYDVVKSAAVTPSATYPIPHGWSEDRLRDFYRFSINQTEFFEDGNIEAIAGTDSGYGAIFAKDALVALKSKGFETERERDASLRATELVNVADYGVWELDDTRGAALRYEIGDPLTTN